MGSRGRGGYREPKQPAGASPPGALSQRTDRGQPVRPVAASRPGGQHGDRQASIEQQSAAPMRAGGAVPAVALEDPGTAGPPMVDADTMVWGPSERPWEPVTAGATLGPGPVPNPLQNLRDQLGAWYSDTGWPDLLDMLEELDEQIG